MAITIASVFLKRGMNNPGLKAGMVSIKEN
jgi:hypothetical protein